jgi:hypothetical protein
VYIIKKKSNSTKEGYKDRLVVKGFKIRCHIDYEETFIYVIEVATIYLSYGVEWLLANTRYLKEEGCL